MMMINGICTSFLDEVVVKGSRADRDSWNGA